MFKGHPVEKHHIKDKFQMSLNTFNDKVPEPVINKY